jgi:hypothetical protein
MTDTRDGEMSPPSEAKDPISAIIGNIGRWQIQGIVIAILISIPGLCHIYCVVFGTVRTDFWCADGGAELTNGTRNECVDGCSEYKFDISFWTNTIPMEFELVCDRAYLVGE